MHYSFVPCLTFPPPPPAPLACCFETLGAVEPAGRAVCNVSQYIYNIKIPIITHLGLCLRGFLGLLTLLGLCNRLLSRHSTNSIRLVPLSQDTLQVGTNTDDTALMFDCLATTLLGYFLCDSLFVHSAEYLSPSNFTWVLALQEE